MEAERTEMEVRVEATQRTADRFKDHPFDPGKFDCAKMLIAHCRNMGRPLKLGAKASYTSLMSGRAVLKRLGVKTVGEVLDANGFARIAPAFATTGDILQMRSLEEDEARPLGAFVIVTGNQTVLGYHEDAVGAVIQRLGTEGDSIPLDAWRVR